MDFVSDNDFENCVRWVVDGYRQSNGIRNNGIDPFKTVFDMYNRDMSFGSWEKLELQRQSDKTVNNKIGEFHQKLLGCVDGWDDLQTGDVADLSNTKRTIFIELKNRWNTVKGSDMIHMWNKLYDIVTKKYPGSTAYWGFMNEKYSTSGEAIWEHQGHYNPDVKKIWGKNVYSLVTGEEDSLEKTWIALPNVLDAVLKKTTSLNPDDKKNLQNWFKGAY